MKKGWHFLLFFIIILSDESIFSLMTYFKRVTNFTPNLAWRMIKIIWGDSYFRLADRWRCTDSFTSILQFFKGSKLFQKCVIIWLKISTGFSLSYQNFYCLDMMASLLIWNSFCVFELKKNVVKELLAYQKKDCETNEKIDNKKRPKKGSWKNSL